jgi:hypothetical protein
MWVQKSNQQKDWKNGHLGDGKSLYGRPNVSRICSPSIKFGNERLKNIVTKPTSKK